jgi:DNA-binding response OmpR family regulator
VALIVVIDDDAAIREIVRRFLTEAKHTVLEAENGNVGLALAEHHRPALVITDIVMPEKEGIETIRDIRRLKNGTKIIAMSGGTPSKGMLYLEAARTLGADAILINPFRKTELLLAVRDVLTAG